MLGLIVQHRNQVKLHVTLINTKYRKVSDRPTSKKKQFNKWQQTLNATSIIKKHSNYYFGEVLLNSIRLSYISTIGDDGNYKSIADVSI